MIKENDIIAGADNQPISIDIYYNELKDNVPLIIYAHGFCGFKDWGNIELVAGAFIDNGLAFACFNFSHNGVTTEKPEDFVRLDLFSRNNFTKELYDFKMVLEYFSQSDNRFSKIYNRSQIGIIGHSMGGGIALLTTLENKIVKAVCTWASVKACNTPFGNWTAEKMNKWKKDGVAYYKNGRTKQDLPMNYQLVEDTIKHKERLNIEGRVSQIEQPVLICHGTEDSSVPFAHAEILNKIIQHAKLFSVSSDHVFGRKHPDDGTKLPEPMQEVLKETISFFKTNL